MVSLGCSHGCYGTCALFVVVYMLLSLVVFARAVGEVLVMG